MMFPQMPFQRNHFHQVLWVYFVSVRPQKTGNPETSPFFVFFTHPFCFSPSLLFLFLLGIFSPSLSLSDPMKKKMKGVADPTATFKHHALIHDYLQLLKETEVVKDTLERAKEKKLTLLDEVRFLRRRHKYLIKKRSSNRQPTKKPEIQSRNNVKRRNQKAKNAPPHTRALGIDLNQKGMAGNGKQASSACGGKDVALRNYVDIDMKDRACNRKEAVFDLNQISREEEEAKRFEEARARSGREEQQNDMRLSVCRNIGNGNSGAWQDQDQVALTLRV